MHRWTSLTIRAAVLGGVALMLIMLIGIRVGRPPAAEGQSICRRWCATPTASSTSFSPSSVVLQNAGDSAVITIMVTGIPSTVNAGQWYIGHTSDFSITQEECAGLFGTGYLVPNGEQPNGTSFVCGIVGTVAAPGSGPVSTFVLTRHSSCNAPSTLTFRTEGHTGTIYVAAGAPVGAGTLGTLQVTCSNTTPPPTKTPCTLTGRVRCPGTPPPTQIATPCAPAGRVRCLPKLPDLTIFASPYDTCSPPFESMNGEYVGLPYYTTWSCTISVKNLASATAAGTIHPGETLTFDLLGLQFQEIKPPDDFSCSKPSSSGEQLTVQCAAIKAITIPIGGQIDFHLTTIVIGDSNNRFIVSVTLTIADPEINKDNDFAFWGGWVDWW